MIVTHTLYLLLIFLLLVTAPILVQCTIQIIGTGTGRTGSTTLQEALSILGYKTYHMKEILTGSRHDHLDFWFDAFKTNCSHPETLKHILEMGAYNATVHAINFPCHDALLFDLYPQAKVIHTERSSAELWHDSVSNSICKLAGDSWFVHVMGLFFPIFRKFTRFTPYLMGRAVFGLYSPIHNVTREYCYEHKNDMIDFYNAHNKRIRQVVPKERLLVLSNHIGGWGPICEFLEIPVPDVPFPHVNKRDSMLKNIFTIMRKRYSNVSLVVKLSLAFMVLLIIILVIRLLKMSKRIRVKSKSKTE